MSTISVHYTDPASAVEDVATELGLYWNVEHADALDAVQTFADNGGDGSGMTFAEQVAENTAYIVAEYMIEGEYVSPGGEA